MGRPAQRWLASTCQCPCCSERVTRIDEHLLCTSCYQLRRLFPRGETNSSRRGHIFLPRSLIKDAPRLYATENTKCPDKKIVARYFVGGAEWYLAELDPETGDAFGYADLGYGEWGYFNLVEIESRIVDGWMVVERDVDFRPRKAAELGFS